MAVVAAKVASRKVRSMIATESSGSHRCEGRNKRYIELCPAQTQVQLLVGNGLQLPDPPGLSSSSFNLMRGF
jgi:hypothetical protein